MSLLFEKLILNPDKSELSSIIFNLENVLNSKQGMYVSCLEYGLPNNVEQAFSHIPTSAISYSKDILQVISKFEPRIYNSILTFVSAQGLVLKYLLKFKIKKTEGFFSLYLNVSYDAKVVIEIKY